MEKVTTVSISRSEDGLRTRRVYSDIFSLLVEGLGARDTVGSPTIHTRINRPRSMAFSRPCWRTRMFKRLSARPRNPNTPATGSNGGVGVVLLCVVVFWCVKH